MAFDDDDREDMERFNHLVDHLNELVRDEHYIVATRVLCVALRHALLLIPDVKERSRQVAICMNTLEEIPGLDQETVEHWRRLRRPDDLRWFYMDTREP